MISLGRTSHIFCVNTTVRQAQLNMLFDTISMSESPKLNRSPNTVRQLTAHGSDIIVFVVPPKLLLSTRLTSLIQLSVTDIQCRAQYQKQEAMLNSLCVLSYYCCAPHTTNSCTDSRAPPSCQQLFNCNGNGVAHWPGPAVLLSLQNPG